MGKLIHFMHVSLDGFVAGPNGEMDWIRIDDEIFEFAGNCTNESDTALYGRVTWEMMDAYWPTAADKPNASKHDVVHSHWYKRVAKVIISSSLAGKEIPNTRIISNNLETEINQLKLRTERDILIFGSPGAAHALSAAGLIDEYWLFVNPVLLAEGISMFKNLKGSVSLELVSSHTFPSGVVCLHYKKGTVN